MTLLALLLLPDAPARELVNDGCVCSDPVEDTVYAQGGFADGECWASVYVPSAGDYPFEPDYVNLLISGGSTGDIAIFDMAVYAVDGSNKPSTNLSGFEAFQATSSSTSMNQVFLVDFKTLDIPTIESGNVAIVVCLDGHAGYPAIARDGDGNDHPDRNWIYTQDGQWVKSDDYRVAGDWIMRLGIDGDSDTDTDSDSDTDSDTDTDTDTDTDADPGELDLFAIAPSSTKAGTAVDLVLFGSGFVQGADARIGGLSITGATVEDSGTISGRSPTSLPSGVHDVEVRNPDGTSAYLAAAFTVEADEHSGCGCLALPVSPTTVAAWGLPLLALVVGRRRAGAGSSP